MVRYYFLLLQYLHIIGVELGYKNYEDWYNISKEDIIQHGGRVLVNKYHFGSPRKLVTSIYPNYNWKMWKFNKVPDGYWHDMKHQRNFMDWLGIISLIIKLIFNLGSELGYTTYEDWYEISYEDINKHGGGLLMKKFCDGSPSKLVMSSYPDFNWKIWKFTQVPDGFWNDFKNQKKFMDFLGAILN